VDALRDEQVRDVLGPPTLVDQHGGIAARTHFVAE